MNPQEKETASSTRTADLLGALSLAGDLAVGLPAEHGLRTCLIAMRLARHIGLSESELVTTYYTSLLMDAGCTAWTSQIAKRMMTDEIVARRELVFRTNIKNPIEAFGWMARFVARDAPLVSRAGPVAAFATQGREILREGFLNTCDVASSLAARLGMASDVQSALLSVFEQWDGSGFPRGLRRQSIPVCCRIVYLAAFFEVFHADGGREAAIRLVRKGSGRAFDPGAVDALLDESGDEAFWDDLEDNQSLWPLVTALEPRTPHSRVSDRQLGEALEVVADFVDLKSPHLLGHSRRVAKTVEAIADCLRLPPEERADLRYAAYTHDLGLVAVPSFVLEKAQANLSRVEWEQMRLHPYHGERILANVPTLRGAAALVGAHHERLDGEGYYRGLRDRQVPMGSQIIAVADRFDELTHDAPGRPGLETEVALTTLRPEVGTGFSASIFEALEHSLGRARSHTGRVRPDRPGDLTDRELEVLQLAAKGMSRKDMAHKLYVSESTVRTHLEHIYAKIGVSSRAAATLFAVEHQLLD